MVRSKSSGLGGTSAGAINALVYALGYTLEEQKDIISSIDFAKFKDRSWIVADIRRVFSKFGLYKGEFFENWIGDLIEAKLGSRLATFADLQKTGLPDLYVYGTNLNTGFSEVFSHERHPNMPLMQAVRISMSIPLFFTSVKQGEYDDTYVDGGVMSNYPVKLFDRRKYIAPDESYAARPTNYYEEENAAFLAKHPDSSPYVYNRQTLGIRLDSDKEVAQFRYGADPKRKSVDVLL